MQTPQRFTYQATATREIHYLLYLPPSLSAAETKRWPLLLFLHGAGERGADLAWVAVHGPPKILAQRPDFPFILVSPQCPADQLWNIEALAALVEDISRRYPVDPARRYLTGLSMGGYATWDLGLRRPDLFAAIAPICGGGDLLDLLLAPTSRAPALCSLGIWAFHGAKDTLVPLSESGRMVEGCRRVGIQDVRLTVYPDAEHDSWTATYDNPELYAWFLKHHR